MSQSAYDVIVIGEGISGLAAARELAASALTVATLEAQLFGGLVINVNELEPPITGKPASGAELAAEMMQANSEAGVTSIQEDALHAEYMTAALRLKVSLIEPGLLEALDFIEHARAGYVRGNLQGGIEAARQCRLRLKAIRRAAKSVVRFELANALAPATSHL
jgi:ribulose 1,5-bisphosphate synthetase/thiazole synthase